MNFILILLKKIHFLCSILNVSLPKNWWTTKTQQGQRTDLKRRGTRGSYLRLLFPSVTSAVNWPQLWTALQYFSELRLYKSVIFQIGRSMFFPPNLSFSFNRFFFFPLLCLRTEQFCSLWVFMCLVENNSPQPISCWSEWVYEVGEDLEFTSASAFISCLILNKLYCCSKLSSPSYKATLMIILKLSSFALRFLKDK